MAQRPYNFAAGPATLPEQVLQRAAEELLNWHDSGMSVMEMTHRGAVYQGLFEKVMADFRRLLGITDQHRLLFMQGGATAQNALVPMNLMGAAAQADYVHTGHWSEKSINEAKKYGDVHLAASAAPAVKGADGQRAGQHAFTYIPDASGWKVRPNADYLHICGNETIGGVEYHAWPDLVALGAPQVPLVVDMSSHVLSRPMDFSSIGLAYGGAQKNLGIAGLTFLILDESWIMTRAPKAHALCPSVFDYRRVLANDSMMNTPPTFAIYITGLLLEWIEQQGGVATVGRLNAEKAALLYDALDASSFYETRVEKKSRSLMNIPFYLPDERLYEPFLRGAAERGLLNLKGHKAVGGLRASLYNAMPRAGAEALVGWLHEFERGHA
jgi:phosphoserine aminotransferase